MEIIKITAIGIICAVISITLKKTNPEMAVQVGIAAGLLIFMMIASYLTEAVAFIKEIANKYALEYGAITLVLKVTGIAYICEFAVETLKDAGEGAIGSKVELAGKLIIAVITIPMIKDFFGLVVRMLG